VGSVDPRRETIRRTHWRFDAALVTGLSSRKPSWPAVKCDRIKQAGHMDASEPT